MKYRFRYIERACEIQDVGIGEPVIDILGNTYVVDHHYDWMVTWVIRYFLQRQTCFGKSVNVTTFKLILE